MTTAKATAKANLIDRHVGARVRQARTRVGLNQEQFGALIGVTYQQCCKYEKGINRISAGRLAAIAAACGVEPGWFFEGLNEPVASEPSRLDMELMRDLRTLSQDDRQLARAVVRRLAEYRR